MPNSQKVELFLNRIKTLDQQIIAHPTQILLLLLIQHLKETSNVYSSISVFFQRDKLLVYYTQLVEKIKKLSATENFLNITQIINAEMTALAKNGASYRYDSDFHAMWVALFIHYEVNQGLPKNSTLRNAEVAANKHLRDINKKIIDDSLKQNSNLGNSQGGRNYADHINDLRAIPRSALDKNQMLSLIKLLIYRIQNTGDENSIRFLDTLPLEELYQHPDILLNLTNTLSNMCTTGLAPRNQKAYLGNNFLAYALLVKINNYPRLQITQSLRTVNEIILNKLNDYILMQSEATNENRSAIYKVALPFLNAADDLSNIINKPFYLFIFSLILTDKYLFESNNNNELEMVLSIIIKLDITNDFINLWIKNCIIGTVNRLVIHLDHEENDDTSNKLTEIKHLIRLLSLLKIPKEIQNETADFLISISIRISEFQLVDLYECISIASSILASFSIKDEKILPLLEELLEHDNLLLLNDISIPHDFQRRAVVTLINKIEDILQKSNRDVGDELKLFSLIKTLNTMPLPASLFSKIKKIFDANIYIEFYKVHLNQPWVSVMLSKITPNNEDFISLIDGIIKPRKRLSRLHDFAIDPFIAHTIQVFLDTKKDHQTYYILANFICDILPLCKPKHIESLIQGLNDPADIYFFVSQCFKNNDSGKHTLMLLRQIKPTYLCGLAKFNFVNNLLDYLETSLFQNRSIFQNFRFTSETALNILHLLNHMKLSESEAFNVATSIPTNYMIKGNEFTTTNEKFDSTLKNTIFNMYRQMGVDNQLIFRAQLNHMGLDKKSVITSIQSNPLLLQDAVCAELRIAHRLPEEIVERIRHRI